jgi:predicted permease
VTRFYRALLHCYPASFRNEYGEEMCAVFDRRWALGSGPLSSATIAVGAVVEVVGNAAMVHWDILRQDLRYAARALRRSPGFALTAVLVVALGVGANTAAFSVADFVLLRPLPFPDPDRLVRIWEHTPGYPEMELSPANYKDWKARSGSFAGMGVFTRSTATLTGAGEPQFLQTALVSADLFPVLGVAPLLGRGFTAADSLGTPAVVLSHGLWQTRFGGDPAILGIRLDLNGIPHQVIGVMPQTFGFPTRDRQLWTLLQVSEKSLADRTDTYLKVVGRLRQGVSVEHSRADLRAIAAQLEREFPRENARTGATVVPFDEQLPARARLLVLALSGAALCILLLACANLSNLLLARAGAREREIAVRASLGAGRERLVRQLVTESVLLVGLGGVLGVLVAAAGVPLLGRLVPDVLPSAQQPSVDLRVIGFAALIIALTGIVAGVFPSLRAAGASELSALRGGARAGGGRTQRLRGVLVTVEVMASVVLLISGGLLVRAMLQIQAVDPGFRAEGVLTLRTMLPTPKYSATQRREEFFGQVLPGVRAIPGVTNAAYISFLPIASPGGIWRVRIAGEESATDAFSSVSLRFITPRFFATLEIPLRRGRDVEETDAANRPLVAVVSESFAKRHWPDREPLGKHFMVAADERTVVGVVGDIRVRGRERESEPQVYLPYRQAQDGQLETYIPKDLVIQSSLPSTTLLPAVRRIVRAADPDQPIANERPLTEVVAEEIASRAAQLRVLAVLTVVALLLAGVGIHGLLSFTVSRRSHEIGVRLALGAPSRGVVRMVLKEGLLLALAGVVPGVILAYFAGRGMEAILAGVEPADPATFGVAIALCGLTTIIGCVRPAVRAARVDPMAALRSE